jgi:hypothetical protein
MNREDIIRMAREAGNGDMEWSVMINPLINNFGDEIERFADLVAAAEREACAELCPRFYDTEEVERAIRARGEK